MGFLRPVASGMTGVVSSTEQLSPAQVRSAAVGDLLAHLGVLVAAYSDLPPEHRVTQLDRDAERITGELARRLGAARQKIAGVPSPR